MTTLIPETHPDEPFTSFQNRFDRIPEFPGTKLEYKEFKSQPLTYRPPHNEKHKPFEFEKLTNLEQSEWFNIAEAKQRGDKFDKTMSQRWFGLCNKIKWYESHEKNAEEVIGKSSVWDELCLEDQTKWKELFSRLKNKEKLTANDRKEWKRINSQVQPKKKRKVEETESEDMEEDSSSDLVVESGKVKVQNPFFHAMFRIHPNGWIEMRNVPPE